MISLFLAKCFANQPKITNKLLSKENLKKIKFPNIKVMIIDDNLNFSWINDLVNSLNLKFAVFKLDNDEILKKYILKNTDIKGNIKQDIVFYQVNSKNIKYYSNIIHPDYILINKTDSIINLDENKELFEKATIIFNKNYHNFNGISYSSNDNGADNYISNIDLIKEQIEINNQYTLNIKKEENTYLETILMLFSLFSNIFNIEKVIQAFNELNAKKFTYKNKSIFINVDEMNYNEAVKYITRYNDYKVLVIGWRTNHEDISWLYNIEMERLINKNIQKIYCIGVNAYDIATRLKYSDFNEKNIVVSPNIDLILNELKNYNLNLYVLADNYYINVLKEGKTK